MGLTSVESVFLWQLSLLHVNYRCSPVPFWVVSFLRGKEGRNNPLKANEKSSHWTCLWNEGCCMPFPFTYFLSCLFVWTHLLQPCCCGINLLARVIQTWAECMFLLLLLDLGVEANNNSSRVGTAAGYLSQAVLGGLYFTAVKKNEGFLFP